MRSRTLVAAVLILGAASVGAASTGAGTISGETTDAVTGAPVEGALVVLDPGRHVATTDADGRFAFREVTPDTYHVEALKAGYQTSSAGPFALSPDGSIDLSFLLQPHVLRETVVVVPDEPPPESGPFPSSMSHSDLTRTEGALDDPLRALVSLPGVAAINDLKPDLRLRGGEPGDTIFRLDGVVLDNPYHFRGARASTTALNIDAFERLTVKVAGAGAEVGNTVSGAVELTPSERGRDGTFLDAALGSLALRVTAGGALGPDGGSWLASGRYSNLELYRSFLNSTRTSVPDFRDLFLRARQPVAPGVDLVAGALGSSSSDQTVDDEGDPSTLLEAQTWMTYLGFDASLAGDLHLSARVARTDFRQTVEDDGEPLEDDEVKTAVFLDMTHGPPERPGWRAGMEVARIDGSITGTFDEDAAESFPAFRAHSNRAGAFAAFFLRPSRWTVELGMRADRDSRAGWAPPQPRVRAEYASQTFWSLFLSLGRYAQFPRYEQEFLAGEESLEVPISDELSVGTRLELPRAVQVQVNAFVRVGTDLSAEVVNTLPDLAEPMGRFEDGRTEGVEVAVRRDRGRLQPRLSFTTLRARASRDGAEFLRNADQPYRIDVATAYILGDRWEISGRYQLASGLPYSAWEPLGGGDLALGALNADRLPPTSRLDLRATYERRWDLLRARFYVEVLNALDRDNLRSRELRWNAGTGRYEHDDEASLPRLPAFGVELLWGP